METADYFRIKGLIENKDNQHTHLQALKEMVDKFGDKYGRNELFNELLTNYKNLSSKWEN
jgi:hypothetical protein